MLTVVWYRSIVKWIWRLKGLHCYTGNSHQAYKHCCLVYSPAICSTTKDNIIIIFVISYGSDAFWVITSSLLFCFVFFLYPFPNAENVFFPTLSPIIIPVDNNIIVLFSVCAILWICERRTHTHSSPLMSSPPSPTLSILALRLTMQGYPEPKLVPGSVQQAAKGR